MKLTVSVVATVFPKIIEDQLNKKKKKKSKIILMIEDLIILTTTTISLMIIRISIISS